MGLYPHRVGGGRAVGVFPPGASAAQGVGRSALGHQRLRNAAKPSLPRYYLRRRDRFMEHEAAASDMVASPFDEVFWH